MAQPVPHQPTDKKRVKVYELRNNDWFDRGTGFCSASFETLEDGRKDPRVIVESEDQPDRLLLETKIQKEDGFQKQQDTLIVWQEPSNGVDMALSFQEAEGCSMIWRFVSSVQQTFHNLAGAGMQTYSSSEEVYFADAKCLDDGLSDDLAIDVPPTINLPTAELGNLGEIESTMRMMSTTANGRDALAKAIMAEDYIGKLIPMVEMAEDLESLQDLHRLCNIMKTVILLNDTSIIEHAVSDECVLGVVGALEYDPDFPSHKANHRHWLGNQGRYKEVVRIEDEQTRRKIHQTYRLQYLKDVVLARILDDPTFSVLNSLIFFNQVDIVQHLQANAAFLNELFGIFSTANNDQKRKKEAVLFIQQCCAIAKNIQPPARQTLYNNFIAHGLLQVIHFGLRHHDVGVRVGATDILISIIDHDPQMIRQTLYRQMHENQPPLTDSLIDLLLVEVDLGVKSQISEALKVLLDPGPAQMPNAESFAKANGDFGGRPRPQGSLDPQQDIFLHRFYERSAPRLFKPLLDLEKRTDMSFPVQQASMFTYLIEILCFFIRQHNLRCKFFVMSNNVAQRVAQLLKCPEKYLRLVAIRFFRSLIGLQDEFYIKQLTEKQVLGPILDVLIETMPRDNLLGSASLEFFEFIKKENVKDLIKHLVVNYRERLLGLSSMPTFRDIILRYDQTQGYTSNMDYFLEGEDEIGRRPQPTRLMEQINVEQEQEEYWATSDPEEEEDSQNKDLEKAPSTNGSTASKPLVDYASDEETDENVDPQASESQSDVASDAVGSPIDSSLGVVPPLERLSEKRRREEDEDEDELGKLLHNKRRNSSGSVGSGSGASHGVLRRRKSFNAGPTSGNGPKKIAISLSSALRTGSGPGSNEDS
ncbi:SMK-1 domain-containing protein [Fusarium falciforme]|uniref:SMK-1 domain-containing protein n=1 Tax=Fusarium falciforme TaxID=195108 RepID=UPI002300567E|nr:SMK-1 domain-containing protein [Fusarium falciforme]WAO85174.1 SMK-1 domain-containing protein [Fusarium falciforme]